MMKELITNFSLQLKEAIEIGEKAALKPSEKPIRNVLISGLGGSGIGGTIISQLVENQANVPVNVNKNYFLPNYVDENTLVVISSYSGNTEETLNAFNIALEKSAQIVCVSSGGKTLEIAKEKGLNFIQIPTGYPPRAAFGHSSVQLFYILNHYGIISNESKSQLKAATELLDSEGENIITQAKAIAEKLHGKTPVIYSDAGFEGVAVRLRQQLNENSKMLCWHHAIPEMNHNELVGWAGGNEQLAVVMFRNETDYTRIQKRMEINKEIIANYTSTIVEIWSKGNSDIERTYYLIHLGDWISYLLAEKKDIDAIEVKVIDFLKGELAKV